MNPWELAGQMMGVGTSLLLPYQQQAYSPQVYGNSTTFSSSTDNTFSIGNEPVKEKTVEPPDEFTQLSNHRFHELLDKFSELK